MIYTIELYRAGRVFQTVSDQLPDDDSALAVARELAVASDADTLHVVRYTPTNRALIAALTVEAKP